LTALGSRLVIRKRARRWYGFGQGIAAAGGKDAERRSARFYRHALRLLDPAATPGLDRSALRDTLRRRLNERGLPGWFVQHPRVWALGALVLALLLTASQQHWFATDLAEGKTWFATSAFSTFPRFGIMEGESNPDGRFHTLDEDSPALLLDLGTVQAMSSIKVVNRVNCCRERALPLVIELSPDGEAWHRVGYRRALFDTWTVHFARTSARYIRLRVDRHSILHLRRVSVYALVGAPTARKHGLS
jgi:hypothetical protein